MRELNYRTSDPFGTSLQALSMSLRAGEIVGMAKNAADKNIVLIKGGEDADGDPCRTGYHMYNRSEKLLARVVADFVLRQTGKRAASASRD